MRMSCRSDIKSSPWVRTLAKLQSHKHNLKNRFEIIRTLGEGTYGKVKLAINKYNGEQVAIKYIRKQRIRTEQDLSRIQREIKIMSSVKHPHIVNIMEVYENKEKIILVMEYAAGGELYDYINEKKVLPEPEARKFFRQIVSAIHHCHKMGIVHRDLKLENIVLDGGGNVKIADFGLSNEYSFEHLLSTYCGSPLYASPEIVNGKPYYGPEIDCWSLGVLLYTLVYGAMPFDSSDFKRLKRQITQGDYFEPARPSDASSLIKLLLEIDPDKRATVSTISQHWWVNVGYSYPATEEGLDRNHLHVPVTSLRQTSFPPSDDVNDADKTAPLVTSCAAITVSSSDHPQGDTADVRAFGRSPTRALKTLESADSGCGHELDSVGAGRRRVYNLHEMRTVLDSVDSGHGSLQCSSFSGTFSLDLDSQETGVGAIQEQSPCAEEFKTISGVRKRVPIRHFSYDSADVLQAGRYSADCDDMAPPHTILEPKSKSAPTSPDYSHGKQERARLCKAQYFDLDEADFIYQQAMGIIRT